LELKNESSSFGQEDLQELQSRAAARHRLHHLFVGRPAQAEAGLRLIYKGFSNILARFFWWAQVEK
jgi:hypothetical protein